MLNSLNRFRKKIKNKLKTLLYPGFEGFNKFISKCYGINRRESAEDSVYYNFYKSFNKSAEGTFGSDVPQETLSRACDSKLRVVAFYLPQFHAIPENNDAWGKGFTEWTNVSKAVPQYLGHYQPRLPGELGFYNLTDPRVLQRQVDLAAASGVHAFCFHYYWFSGKKLLERPLDIFMGLNLGSFQFCINWANENWTKRWDGKAEEVIIKQENQPNDAELFFQDILPILRHPNYIQIEPGVPLLLIYRPENIANPTKFAEKLRQGAQSAGFLGLHIVMCQTFGKNDPRPYRFDAACEFPPHGLSLAKKENLTFLNDQFNGKVYDTTNIVAKLRIKIASEKITYPVFRCAFPNWDNSARLFGAGHIMHGMSPSVFQDWLFLISSNTYQDTTGYRWIFINAWNEWGEGACLEPDRKLGFENLNAVARVVDSYGLNSRRQLIAPHEKPLEETSAPLAILLHIFHEDLIDEMLDKVKSTELIFDFYVTATDTLTTQAIQKIVALFPAVRILELNNHGRDVLPFLRAIRHFNLGRYKAVCKLHSKKSPHRQDGDAWRNDLFNNLLNPSGGSQTIKEFAESESSGLLVPEFNLIKAEGKILGGSVIHLKALFAAHKLKPHWDFYFPAGTMFWASGRLLSKVNEIHIGEDQFEIEAGQLDGTLAHAYERFFGAICHKMDWKIVGLKKLSK